MFNYLIVRIHNTSLLSRWLVPKPSVCSCGSVRCRHWRLWWLCSSVRLLYRRQEEAAARTAAAASIRDCGGGAGLAGLPLHTARHTSTIDFLAGGGWQLIRGGCADLCVSSQRDQVGGGPVSHTHRYSAHPPARPPARALEAGSSGQLLSQPLQ